MSALTNIWSQLVQRRLWPVAIILLAALAAVPVVLAKDPEPVIPPPAAAPVDDGESALAETPVVALATSADAAERRRVLGSRKNPFGVAKTAQLADEGTGGVVSESTGDSPSGEATKDPAAIGGGTDAPATGTPAPAAPTTPVAPKKTYDLYDLTVRFGDAAGATQRMTLKRLQPLPSAADPLLIYMGVLKDGKTAVFLVDKDVSAVGDGECKPSADACETIRMTVGETEFFDVLNADGSAGAQFQLDLLKIHKGATTSASKASAASKRGQRVLRARGAAPFRFDAASGTIAPRPGALGNAVRSTSAIG